MDINLNEFQFTQDSDFVFTKEQIINPQGNIVNTLNGNDKINSIGFNILNLGKINTGKGDDQIVALSKARGGAVFGILNSDNFDSVIKTGQGDDIVRGFATFEESIGSSDFATGNGIYSQNTSRIETGAGDDTVEGLANIVGPNRTSATGIRLDNGGIVKTGNGNDTVSGTANSIALNDVRAEGIRNIRANTQTGDGNDTVIGEAFGSSGNKAQTWGINNLEGTIRTGQGNDKVSGSAISTGNASQGSAKGIDNTKGFIFTGNGDDLIFGEAQGVTDDTFGISGGTINTGRGNDKVIGKVVNGNISNALGGGVNIKLGDGDDILTGFGDAIVSGGTGIDELKLEGLNSNDFSISLGSTGNNQVNFDFLADRTVMSTKQFEIFSFDNGTFSFSEIASMAA